MKSLLSFVFVFLGFHFVHAAESCKYTEPLAVKEMSYFCSYDYTADEKQEMEDFYGSYQVFLFPGFLKEAFGINAPFWDNLSFYFRSLEDEIQTVQDIPLIPEFLEDDLAGGVEYLNPSSKNSVQENTEVAAQEILAYTQSSNAREKVIVIGHSMGGAGAYYLPALINRNSDYSSLVNKIDAYVSLQGVIHKTPVADMAMDLVNGDEPEGWNLFESIVSEDPKTKILGKATPFIVKKLHAIVGDKPFVSMQRASSLDRRQAVQALPKSISEKLMFVSTSINSENINPDFLPVTTEPDSMPFSMFPTMVYMKEALGIENDGLVPRKSQVDVCVGSHTVHINNADHSSLVTPKGVSNTDKKCRVGFSRYLLLKIMKRIKANN